MVRTRGGCFTKAIEVIAVAGPEYPRGAMVPLEERGDRTGAVEGRCCCCCPELIEGALGETGVTLCPSLDGLSDRSPRGLRKPDAGPLGDRSGGISGGTREAFWVGAAISFLLACDTTCCCGCLMGRIVPRGVTGALLGRSSVGTGACFCRYSRCSNGARVVRCILAGTDTRGENVHSGSAGGWYSRLTERIPMMYNRS